MSSPYFMTFAKVPGIPEPYELVRIGFPEMGEQYLDSNGTTVRVAFGKEEFPGPVPVLYNPKGWRQATHAEAARLPIAARFRDKYNEPWVYGTVVEYVPSLTHKWKDGDTGMWFKRCEFYVGE